MLVVAAMALLAACGSSSSSSSSSPSPSASASGVTTTVAGIPITSDPALKAMLPAAIQTANQIRVASDIPYPPWEYYTSATSKQATGFDYDLSQAIGAKIGIPVSFNETPFDSIILSIKGGRRDMIMSDMYDNATREKQGVSFVDYAYDGTSILVKKGNPSGITNLDSLAGKTVVVESGATQQVVLQTLNKQFKSSGKPVMTILALPNQPAALLAVSSARAVGDLSDHSTVEYIAKTANNGNSFEVVADPAAPQGYYPQLVGAGIVASDTALVTTVQKALQDLIADGTYQKIIAKYGLLLVTSAQVNQGGKPVSPSPSS
jgi:polar amino acid transport system substrate-binding protein